MAVNKVHQTLQVSENWIKDSLSYEKNINNYYNTNNYDGFFNYLNDINQPNKNSTVRLLENRSPSSKYNEYYGDLNRSNILTNGKRDYDLSVIDNIVGNKQQANILKEGFYIDNDTGKMACDENKINWNALPSDIVSQKDSIIDLALSELNQTALKVVPASNIRPIKTGINKIEVVEYWPPIFKFYLNEVIFQKIMNFINYNKGSNADIFTGIFTILSTAIPSLTEFLIPIAAAIVIMFVYFEILQNYDKGYGVGFELLMGIMISCWGQ